MSRSVSYLDVAINLDIAYKDQNFVKLMFALLTKDEMYKKKNSTYFEKIVNTRVLKVFQRHIVAG